MLGRTAKEQVGMKLDAVDDTPQDALQVLLLLTADPLGKELINTAQDGIIIGRFHETELMPQSLRSCTASSRRGESDFLSFFTHPILYSAYGI